MVFIWANSEPINKFGVGFYMVLLFFRFLTDLAYLISVVSQDPDLGRLFAALDLFGMWNAAFALLVPWRRSSKGDSKGIQMRIQGDLRGSRDPDEDFCRCFFSFFFFSNGYFLWMVLRRSDEFSYSIFFWVGWVWVGLIWSLLAYFFMVSFGVI